MTSIHNMFPNKMVVYFDKISGDYMIRMVDEEFDTILTYGCLPAMCSISTLFVETTNIDHIRAIPLCNTEGVQQYEINKDYRIEISGNSTDSILRFLDRSGGRWAERDVLSILFGIPERWLGNIAYP